VLVWTLSVIFTSDGYGYTVDRSIGYGYVRGPENGVDRDQVLSGR
jgi:4-methylaminobutanoate oxidase (formaldehyde-forming)